MGGKYIKIERTLEQVFVLMIALCYTLALSACFGSSSSGGGGGGSGGSSLRVEKSACQQMNLLNPQPLAMNQQDAEVLPAVPPDPFCSCRVAMGEQIPLVALMTEGDGSERDVTEDVQWTVNQPGLGTVLPGGILSAQAPGTIAVVACLDDLCSAPEEFIIIEDPKVVVLEIFAEYYFPVDFLTGIGVDVEAAADCWECYFEWELRLLLGDTSQFFARGILETGRWVDLTGEVDWHSSAPAIADIDAQGLLTAHAEGQTDITATYGELVSNTVKVEVLKEAELQELYIYRHSWAGILQVGQIDQFHAEAYYDPWMIKEVTKEVTWLLSDPTVAVMSAEGILTGLAPGQVSIQAEYQGKFSNVLDLEVWDVVALEYCDPAQPNRSFWEDEYNRVILETDCATYDRPGEVHIRYTIEENQPHPWGILDPCLDLMIQRPGNGQVIKTLRFEGCGDLDFAREADLLAGYDPIYQYSTVWDMRDDSGQLVPPGRYTILGRFYIYYDPVITLDIQLQ